MMFFCSHLVICGEKTYSKIDKRYSDLMFECGTKVGHNAICRIIKMLLESEE